MGWRVSVQYCSCTKMYKATHRREVEIRSPRCKRPVAKSAHLSAYHC